MICCESDSVEVKGLDLAVMGSGMGWCGMAVERQKHQPGSKGRSGLASPDWCS